MYPFTGDGLLEGSSFIRTKITILAGYREDLFDEDGLKTLTTGFSGDTVHFLQSHWPSGMYGTP